MININDITGHGIDKTDRINVKLKLPDIIKGDSDIASKIFFINRKLPLFATGFFIKSNSVPQARRKYYHYYFSALIPSDVKLNTNNELNNNIYIFRRPFPQQKYLFKKL